MTSLAGASSLRRAGAAILLLLAVASSTDGRPAPSAQVGALIDTPYLSQTPLLCGGAALAMVLRYWGDADVRPQDFAHLVDEAAGGISAGRLIDAVRAEGWQAMAASSSLPSLAGHVAQGRPVIALIEDSPGAFHYVVVVGTTPSSVVVHDPARAPYVVWTHAEFERRWAASSHLMILVLPADAGLKPGPSKVADTPSAIPDSLNDVSADASFTRGPASTTEGAPSACDALVARGVALARDDRDSAERVLESATNLCPDDAAGYRELAGLRLLQQRWDESIALARQAIARDAGDRHAREVLATSRFASGDRLGALRAWNALGSPSIDQVAIEGLRRTSQPVLTRALGLHPGDVLTASDFTRASRRLEDFPTAGRPRLRYTPLVDDRASVQVFADERRLIPAGVIGWARVAVRSAITREVRLDISAPFSQGDAWQPSLRWPAARRRLGVAAALPAPGLTPGLLHLEVFRERQTYALSPDGSARIEATRRRVGVGYTDWMSGALRIELGAAIDRHDSRRHVALRAGGTWRLMEEHLTGHLRAERWFAPTGSGQSFHTIDASLDLRSASSVGVPSWNARIGFSQASTAAPLALWPGAGASHDRTALLRARRLIANDVLSGEAFGRRLAYGTVERQHPVRRSTYGTLAVAGFVDVARADRRFTVDLPTPLHVDAGIGLRIERPGEASHIRLDVGVGLRDGRVRASAGYLTRWGQP